MAGGFNSKFSSEQKTRAMVLWAEGMPMKKIAETIGVRSWHTVANWKRDNYPDSWTKFKREHLEKTAKKLQDETLDSMASVKARHQKMLRSISGATGSMLAKQAAENKLDPEVARMTFFDAVESEQKLYLPLEMALAQGVASRQGLKVQGSGEFVLTYMEEEYERTRRGGGGDDGASKA